MTQEIYALATNRNAAFATAFLDKFLPSRTAFADEYPVPECADTPTVAFTAPDEVMVYLEANPTEPYSLYWNASSGDDPIRQAMLFYTVDRHLILGLATVPSESRKMFDQLVLFASSGIGVFGSEQCPPETASEFRAMAQQAPRG